MPIRSSRIVHDVPIASLTPYPRNPRRGDVERIKASMQRIGFYGAVVVQESTGYIIAGNHRVQAWAGLGHATMPTVEFVDVDDTTAREILLADNRASDAATYDASDLLAIVESFGDGVDLSWAGWSEEDIADLHIEQTLGDQAERERMKRMQPYRRPTPIDMIFTWTPDRCPPYIATEMGYKLGTMSRVKGAVTKPERWVYRPNGLVAFVDNEYHDYDHAHHVGFVKQLGEVQGAKPKYATVRDIMTKKQCEQAKVPYFPLEQIMEFAAELEEHAENVIVIPKWDCIDKLPERYVLGYSVYGATPIPMEHFRGHRIHLLGGSPDDQLSYLGQMQDDVVSLDFNMASKAALFGSFYGVDGKTHNVDEIFESKRCNAHWPVAIACSLYAFRARVEEMFQIEVAPASALNPDTLE